MEGITVRDLLNAQETIVVGPVFAPAGEAKIAPSTVLAEKHRKR